MATVSSSSSLSAIHLKAPSKFSSSHARHFPQTSINLQSFSNHTTCNLNYSKTAIFAITGSSDSPKSLDEDPQILLQQLANAFVLPADYFSQLPNDLRLDLNDAAFDLSNGPVKDECGEELGDTLLDLTRAWERADTSTSASLMSKLPSLATGNNKSVSTWQALDISW